MKQELASYRQWFALGVLMLVAVTVVSVIPLNQPIPIQGADKYEHVLAYFVLMYWWGMVQADRRLAWLVALPLFGLLLEGVQGLTPHRFMEWRDAAANTAGVILGILVLNTPAAGLLASVDARLRNRRDPG